MIPAGSQESENDLFVKFKSLIRDRILGSADVSGWCLRYGVEIIPEMHEIAPIEAFMFGYRVLERVLGEEGSGLDHVLKVTRSAHLNLGRDVLDLIVMVGDRIPVSVDEDLVYLFPRDFYDKVLLFNMVPN